jgi:hypothetical protein
MATVEVPAPELRAPPVRTRRFLPAAIVVGVIVAVLFGGYVFAAALSEPTGPPVDVGGVVRVEPLSGWTVAGRSQDPPGVRLSRGGGTLDVAAFGFTGDADALLRAYLERLEPQTEHLSLGAVGGVRLPSGLTGARVHYVGTFGDVQTPIEGELTSVVSPSGVGVVFNGWSAEGLLRFMLDDVGTMIDRAEIR